MINIQYNLVVILLIRYQNEYQPITEALLVVTREINSRVFGKLISRTASGDESGAQLAGSSRVDIIHVIRMCYVVESSATLSTLGLLVVIDFKKYIYLSVRIIWVRKRRPDDILKQSELLQELILNELLEFICL